MIQKNGRPPSYSDDQVLTGIELVEREGQIPTGDNVKNAMHHHFGTSSGINAQSLERKVQQLLEDREHRRTADLIAQLPDGTKQAAALLGDRFVDDVTKHLAHSFATLRNAANKTLNEKEQDLTHQRNLIQDLQDRLETKDAHIADLEAANVELTAQLEASKAQVVELAGQLADLRKEEDLETRLLKKLSPTILRHPDRHPEGK